MICPTCKGTGSVTPCRLSCSFCTPYGSSQIAEHDGHSEPCPDCRDGLICDCADPTCDAEIDEINAQLADACREFAAMRGVQ